MWRCMMEKRDLFKRLRVLACYAFALNLTVCWIAGINTITCSWTYAVSYFALTWYGYEYMYKENEPKVWIPLAVSLGRVAVDIPIRVFDFIGTLGSLELVTTSLLSIALAYICYFNRRPWAFVLSIVTMVLVIGFVNEAWRDYIIRTYYQ